MISPLRLLHLEDDPLDAELIRRRLQKVDPNCELVWARSKTEYEAHLERTAFDLILSDYNIPGCDFSDILAYVRQKKPEMPVIVVSGALGEESAVECLKLGATDYVIKDRLERLVPAVRRALAEVEEHHRLREAERALQENERRFRQLAENSTEGFWFIALDAARVLYFSPGCERIWGISAEQAYKQPGFRMALIHEDDRERVTTAYETWIAGQQPHYEQEYRVMRPDGTMRWVADSGTLIRDESGVPVRASGIIRDITKHRLDQQALERLTKALRTANALLERERATLAASVAKRTAALKTANTQLTETNRLQRAILNSPNLAIFSVNTQGVFKTFNHGAESLLGWRAKEMIDKRTLDSICDPDELAQRSGRVDSKGRRYMSALGAFNYQASANAPEQKQWTLVTRARRPLPALLTVSPLCDEGRDESDGVVGYLCTAIDISERLRAEQERDRFFNLSLDLFCIAGMDGYFKRVNPSFCRVLGYSEEVLFSHSFLDFVHPEDRQATVSKIQNMKQGKLVHDFENRYQCADGSWRFLSWQAVPYEEMIYAAGRDITESKLAAADAQQRTERKLRFQDALLRLRDLSGTSTRALLHRVTEECAHALEVERASIWIFDKTRKILLCQDAFRANTDRHSQGRELRVDDFPNYFQALTKLDVVVADDTSNAPDLHELADSYLMPQGITSLLDIPLYLSGALFGTLRCEHTGPQRNWTRDEIEFVTAVGGFVALSIERMRRRRAELLARLQSHVTEILASAESITMAYPRILRTLGDGLGWEVGHFWAVDTQSGTLQCVDTWRHPKPKATRLVESSQQRNYSVDEGLPGRVWASGKPLWIKDLREESQFTRLPFAQRAGVRSALAFPAQLNGQVSGVLEFFSEHIQEPDTQLLNTLAKIGEQIAQFVARQEAEAALRQSQAELSAANVKLLSAKESAEQASLTKSAFLATMSHEIRTPLNGVLGAMELLARSELGSDQQSLLDTAYNSARDLLRLLNDVLDMAKVEAGRLDLLVEPCSLARLLAQVASTHRPKAVDKGLALTSAIDPLVEDWVLLDTLRLTQVLGNLISNAIKFTTQGSVRIYLELLEREDEFQTVRFKVADTGEGIPPEIVGKLFKPFEQGLIKAARRAAGTGLGLAICRGIIERMGGHIWMESEPGEGSTALFELTLPVTEPPSEKLPTPEITYPTKPSRVPTVEEACQQARLVLVVDDHPTNRILLQRQLAMLGYASVAAEHGVEALAKLQADGYGLVLTDCEMPEMDGYELAQAIRAQGMTTLPVVAVTAHAFVEITERCQRAGMNDVLAKPIDLDVLAGVLAQWLPRRSDVGVTTPQQTPPQAEAPQVAETPSAPLNLSRLAGLSGGDDELEQEILADFQKENTANFNALEQAIATADPASCARLAHRMKGASKAIGAQALGAACERLEAVARDETRQNEITTAFQDMAHTFRALEDYLATRLTAT